MNPVKLTIRKGNVSTWGPNYRFGATLLFECNEGYEHKGPDTITCLEFAGGTGGGRYTGGGRREGGKRDSQFGGQDTGLEQKNTSVPYCPC